MQYLLITHGGVGSLSPQELGEPLTDGETRNHLINNINGVRMINKYTCKPTLGFSITTIWMDELVMIMMKMVMEMI
jgi:hypothetical protein